MKLRLDLLEHLTDQDIMEGVLTNNHRYKPEPLFAQTGKGYLRPATPEEKEEEIRRSEALSAKVKARAAADFASQERPEQS